MANLENLDDDHFARAGAYTKTFYRDVYPSIDPTQPALSQKGKVVVVTGASEGIGARGYPPAFAEAGAKAIVLFSRRADRLREVAQEWRGKYAGTEFIEVAGSVTEPADVQRLFATVREKFGKADVLINNAGITSSYAPIVDMDAEEWWKQFEVNVRGSFLVTKAFLKLLGEGDQATVLTLSSSVTVLTFPGMSGYALTKLALVRLAEFVAVEYPNVVCVALDPGTVLTQAVPDYAVKFAKDTPMLVGASAVWLSSPQAKFMNGRMYKAGWDVAELSERKEEIEKGTLFKFVLDGKPQAAEAVRG